MGRAPELGDRNGLSLGDQGANGIGVPVGYLDGPVCVDPNEVEGCPVDPLIRYGGVGDLSAKPPTDESDGLVQETIEAGGEICQHRPQAIGLGQQGDPIGNTWLTTLGRAVARGEVSPEALHPRVATVAIVLLRNEHIIRGISLVPDSVLVEIVDEVYLPLVRGRGPTPG